MARVTTFVPGPAPVLPPSSVDDRAARPSPPGQEDSRFWGRLYLALYLVYIVLGIAMRAAGWVHGDAVWFVQAARRVLDGSFDLYSFRSAPGVVPPLGAAYSYTPFMAILISPLVWLADALRLGEAEAEWLMAVPLLAVDVLAMQQMRRLARTWRPAVDERFLFAGVLVSLFLTSFLAVSAYYGHDEGLMLLFLLLTIRLTPDRPVLGGLCAGLALAAKQTTALDLIPVGLVLLVSALPLGGKTGNEEGKRRSLAGFLLWAVSALAVFGAFMIVPLLRNPSAVYYAFVTQVARLTAFGPGLPVWADRALQSWLPGSDYQAANTALLNYANWVLLALVALVSVLVVFRARIRGRPVGLVDSRLLALVCFAAVSQIVLGKWVTGHYYQLPLALVFAWDVVRRAPRPDEALSPSVFGSFPWIGLGSAVAFRAITQFGVWWFKESLLLLLFAVIAVVLLVGASRDEQQSQPPA